MILLVDDEILLAELLKDELEDAGFKVKVAPSAKEALGIMKQDPIDLIISDIQMPVMNGVEFGETVRQDGFAGAIFFVSGFGNHFADRIRKMSRTKLYEKPIPLERLKADLAQELKGSAG